MTEHTRPTARYTIYLLSSLVLLAAVYFGIKKYKASKQFVSVPQYKVGIERFSEDKIQYQMAVNKIMIPQATDREFAISQLKQMYAYEQIMRKYRKLIGHQDLNDEMKRILNGSRDPATLNKILQIKGFDPSYTKEIFAKSVLVNRIIFNDFFYATDEIHKETFGQAEMLALELGAKSSDEIKRAILKKGLNGFEVDVTPSHGLKTTQFSPPEVKHEKNGPADPAPLAEAVEHRVAAAKKWLELRQNTPKKGNAYIFNAIQRWEVFYPNKWHPADNNVSGLLVVIPKKTFNEWITEEVKNIKPDDQAIP
jgi:hypothetical protein